MAENTPVPSGRPPKRNRQDFNDAGYNPAVLGASMANIYKDFAVRLIDDPQSNFIFRMESSAGRTRVTIELEIQEFNDAGYNYAVPGTSRARNCRDIAVWFINNPQSNFIANRMESSTGRSKVMIELEIVDAD
jgi:hypothetical protein